MKTFAVIGLGRFGARIATRLCELGNEVIAIDNKSDPVTQVVDHVTRAVIVDGRDKDVLRTLGVRNCDCAIVAIGENLSASILITMNLKELGVPYVVCKAADGMHQRVLEKIGADRIIIPEKEVADRLAHTLSEPNILEYIELSNECGIVEEETPAPWIGKTIRELNVAAKYGVIILAVKKDGVFNVTPSPDEPLKKGVVLVMLGNYQSLDKIPKK